MAKKIKHVMVDCETLATTTHAAVIQVGFAFHIDGVNEVRNMSVSPRVYERYSNMFHVDRKTIEWHMKTNPKNFAACQESTNTLQELAQFIINAVDDAKEGGKYAIWLWACGTDFDIPKLTKVLKVCNLQPNWSYSYVRDYRTLRDLLKDVVPLEKANEHCAGLDAWYQYAHLRQILEFMEVHMPGMRY